MYIQNKLIFTGININQKPNWNAIRTPNLRTSNPISSYRSAKFDLES